MSNHHHQNPRFFTPQPFTKQPRSGSSRYKNEGASRPNFSGTRPTPTHSREHEIGFTKKLDATTSKQPVQHNPEPQICHSQAGRSSPKHPKAGAFNLYSSGIGSFPKLPKFKLISRVKNTDRPTSPGPSDSDHQPLQIKKPISSIRPADLPRRALLFPRKVPDDDIPLSQRSRSPWNKKTSAPIEEDDIPLKSPRKKIRTARRQKGADVSTEPSKTRRLGQSSGSGPTAGAIGLTDEAGNDAEDESSRIDTPPQLSTQPTSTVKVNVPSLTQSANPSITLPATDECNLSAPEISTSASIVSLPPTFSFSDTRDVSSSKPEPTTLPQMPRDRDDTSSLSSLPSDDDDTDSSMSEDTIDDLDFALLQNMPQVGTTSREARQEDSATNPSLATHITSVGAPAASNGIQTSPSNVPIPEADIDDASELGEDVCLEYTDFGAHELGVPVTWSESDYDEGDVSEQPDEFAEFLLMEASDGNSIDMKTFQAIEQHSDDSFEFGSHFSDSEISQTGYMLIKEFESMGHTEHELDHVDDGDESMGGEDGDTTDSLDEDDHSGLVRFGIEVDDEEDDAAFFDLPPDSALGSLLTNFELSGDVEFFILPEESDSSNKLKDAIDRQSISTACLLAANQSTSSDINVAPMCDIQLPVMGSFSVGRRDGSCAGRTIIDEKAHPPVSPFSGGKVVRYNRFKKLRERSCAGDSEISSLGTPKPDSYSGSQAPHPTEQGALSAPEDDFDITAFIRGISSKDGDGFSESGDGLEVEQALHEPATGLEDLSRWRRVPMTAFRRNMMSASASGWANEQPMMLDGAIQPSARGGQTLSLVHAPMSQKKQHAKTLLLSPSRKTGGSSRKERRRRRMSKKAIDPILVKNENETGVIGLGEVSSALGGGSVGVGGEEETRSGLGNKGFDTPLFKSVIEMGTTDVPMLNLMDGIDGLPIE